MRSLAENEIIRRHEFFVDWYTGKAADEDMAACARAFGPDFRIIWPDASEHDRDPLIERLRATRGKSNDDLAIEVTLHHSVDLGPELVLITFDEHQRAGEQRLNSRRATALFSRDDDAPHGVVWRYLQQTWIA